MPEPDLVELFALPLHKAGAHYLVAGSVGAMVYSEPRLTIDIDLAVALDDAALPALPALFPEPAFYCPPTLVLQAENRRLPAGRNSLRATRIRHGVEGHLPRRRRWRKARAGYPANDRTIWRPHRPPKPARRAAHRLVGLVALVSSRRVDESREGIQARP